MTKKIDLNIQPKENILIPSNITYKNWNITISKDEGYYLFRGKMISRAHLYERGICGIAIHYPLPGNLRKYLNTFKKELDQTDASNARKRAMKGKV